MRMQDIEVGETYEVGINRGPKRGVEFSGLRGVVVKTRVNAFYSPYGKKGHVLLHAVDENGLIKLAGDGDGAEPRDIWAQAREVATAEMVDEKKDARTKERALLVDMQRRQREYEAEVTARLARRLNVAPAELTVNVLTRNDGAYHIYRVQLDAGAVRKYLGTDG